MDFTLQRVLQQQECRQRREKQTYQKILDNVNKKIEYQSNQKNTYCLYDVPNFIVGIPSFDRDKAYEFVLNSLKEIGFFVQGVMNYTIFISWEKSHVVRNGKVMSNYDYEEKQRRRELKKLRNSSKELMYSLENKEKIRPPRDDTVVDNFKKGALSVLNKRARQIESNKVLNSNSERCWY